MLLVLLCGCLLQGPFGEAQPLRRWDVIEYFSGTGRLSKMAAKAGLVVASFEILLDAPKSKKRNKHFHPRSSMDMNGESGFAFLGWMIEHASSPLLSLPSSP